MTMWQLIGQFKMNWWYTIRTKC